MKIKKAQPKKIPLGMKRVLLPILLSLVAKGIAITDEIFNAKVVEYFDRELGNGITNAWIGIDTTGNQIADMFIIIPWASGTATERLIGQIKQAGVVSVEDEGKNYSQSLSAYTLSQRNIIKIGDNEIFDIYPNKQGTYPYAFARQERLRGGGR